MTDRILKPLQMTRSSITLSAVQKSNMAMGHSDQLAQVNNWDLPTFAGAGALRSTANDMLKFMAANMGLSDTPLRKAMELSHQIRTGTGSADLSIAMGWHVFDKFNTRVIWHNGGTGGYRTWAGFVPSKKTAVVVLCNTNFGVDDLGLHLSASEFPAKILEPRMEKKEVSVAPEVLRPYVGKYALAPTFIMTVTEEEGKLSLQATGQPKFRIYPESPVKFFLKEVEAAVSFEKSETGEVTGVILHQNGSNQKAKRVP